MRVLGKKDYSLLSWLFSQTQEDLKKALTSYLKNKYDKKVRTTNEFIVAEGNIPIALVAHMDTIYTSPVKDLYYDHTKGVMWSPDGIGADDRAGIFAILKIIDSGLRPHIILTTDEEKGGIGASALAEYVMPFKELKYLIQLDRRGSNDCVFYDCTNSDFIEYVEKFGFVERTGSFSDISFLCPAWDVCGVNLSVGYENEHSYIETLHINPLFRTIKAVKTMLTQESIPDFEWISALGRFKWWESDGNFVICEKCQKPFDEYETIPVIKPDGSLGYYCPDCFDHTIAWCADCGMAYVCEPNDHGECVKCRGK